MEQMSLMPASAASMMASAQKAGATKVMLVVAPVAFTASFTVLKTGSPVVLGAAFARRHAAHDVGAIGDHLLGVEGAFVAGHALNDDRRLFVDEDAHGTSPGGPYAVAAARIASS